VKKEPGTPTSFTRVKKEPDSFTRVKKEHGAPTPPSLKKACRRCRGLAYQAPNDPVEFTGQRAAERPSFNEV
jgi:hypothetical protein